MTFVAKASIRKGTSTVTRKGIINKIKLIHATTVAGHSASLDISVYMNRYIHLRERNLLHVIGCDQCFSRLHQLQEHKKKVHACERPFACNVCDMKFTMERDLFVHGKVHLGEKIVSCDDCGKLFTRPGDLRKHMRIHTGEKPYQCNHCGKCFCESGNLKQHLRKHTGEKPFVCEQCGRCFSQLGNLYAHRNRHTKACKSMPSGPNQSVTPQVKQEPYSCNLCDETFSMAKDLWIHKRIHQGEKPFSCNYCGKFVSKGVEFNEAYKDTYRRKTS